MKLDEKKYIYTNISCFVLPIERERFYKSNIIFILKINYII